VVRLLTSLLVLILGLALGGAAAPGGSGALGDCAGDPKDAASAEQKVAVCTSLIQSGHLQDGDLALAFSLRGNAYLFSGRQARALMDEVKALQIAPTLWQPIYVQGFIYRSWALRWRL